MSGLMWVVIVILFLFLVILLSNITVKISIKKAEKDDRIEVDGWMLFRIIHIKKSIPLVVLESPREGIKYKSYSNIPNQKEKKDRITDEKVAKYKDSMMKMVRNIQDFFKTIEDFLQKVHIDDLNWETKFGLDDAVATGVSAGFLWSFKGTILALLSKYMILEKKPYINVIPKFDKFLFETYLNLTIHLKVYAVFEMGIKMIYRYIKVTMKNKTRQVFLRGKNNEAHKV